ncbi:MAG: DUF6261 family protein [Tannerellaceae bacterium]|nr:DUF6261 family protein [Tannerellaceae bacterium]
MLSRLPVGQGVQYHKETSALIKDDLAQVAGLSDLAAEYENDANVADATYIESLKAIETAEMKRKDTVRGSITNEVVRRVDFAYKNPTSEAEKQSATILKFETDKYLKAVRKDYKTQTAATRNLLADLRSHSADVTALGLTELLNRLETENTEFEDLFLTRTESSGNKTLIGTVSELLTKANDSHEAICVAAEGLLLAKPTPTVKSALESIVFKVNSQIRVYTTIYHRHAGIVAKHRKDKENGNEDEETQTPDTENPTAPPTDPQTPDVTVPPINPDDLNPPAAGERIEVRVDVTETDKGKKA